MSIRYLQYHAEQDDCNFIFLVNPLMPSDDNASEWEIRKLKAKMKDSCTIQSERRTDAVLKVQSKAMTKKKYGQK
jgi:transposase